MIPTVGPWRVKLEYCALPAGLAVSNAFQDPKYVGYHGFIYNRLTGEAIPPWEPIFVLRAKDQFAWEALQHYCDALQKRYEVLRSSLGPQHAETISLAHQLWAVGKRVAEFARFVQEQALVMKSPDTGSTELGAEVA